MPSPEILTRYHELSAFCDAFFACVRTHCAAGMQCGPGCSACCTLKTVSPIEAAVIADYLRGHPLKAKPPDDGAASCAFLLSGLCAIYPARPIICRTQGLPLRYDGADAIACCDLNFTDAAIGEEYILDASKIAENLMRLNLAYCLARGDERNAGCRIKLRELRDATGDHRQSQRKGQAIGLPRSPAAASR
jgi:Fe-S-cluster containining protein